jgi:hypothetical protein
MASWLGRLKIQGLQSSKYWARVVKIPSNPTNLRNSAIGWRAAQNSASDRDRHIITLNSQSLKLVCKKLPVISEYSITFARQPPKILESEPFQQVPGGGKADASVHESDITVENVMDGPDRTD